MRFVAMVLLGLMLAAGAVRAQDAGSGRLGAEIANVSKAEADALGWEAPRGAKVIRTHPNSPAEAAGLQAGDVLVSLDGVEIENGRQFADAIARRQSGQDARLAIVRGGREKRLTVKLGERRTASSEAATGQGTPIPMLDPGGHMALVRSLTYTPDGKQIVSASDDKTIRVWDVATGKTVRIIRGEVMPGEGGKLFAMALSPDGKWLAAAGFLHSTNYDLRHSIRVYNFATGKLVTRLMGHGNVVDALAFSPDGRYLLSGSKDHSAIIWDVTSGKIWKRLAGHRDDIYSVAFTPDGTRALSASDDQEVRMWSVTTGETLSIMRGHKDKVRAVAVSKDGRIASGDWSGEIRLWDGATGTFLKTLARQSRMIRGLVFSHDDRLLLTGNAEGTGNFDCRVFDTATGREAVAYKGHNDIVIATGISPDGKWAATGGGYDRAIHIWDLRTGQRAKGPDGQPLTLGGTGNPVLAAGFSSDGRQIAWGNTSRYRSHNLRGPIEFVLTLPEGSTHLAGPVAAGPGPFVQAKAEQGNWWLKHRRGGNYGYDALLDIGQDQNTMATIERDPTNGYQHRTYGFTPNGTTIISGANNGWLSAYNLNGRLAGHYIGHEGDVWAATPSPDGRFLVSGANDKTLRLWNLKTRELLITLYRGQDGEWVMWTPQGYFAASPAGSGLIGWQINQGPDAAAEYVTAAQLRATLNRPDIVAKAILLESASEAVKQSPGTNFKLADLLANPVPRMNIVAPSANAVATGGSTQLELVLGATPDPVKMIRIQVNGMQISEHQPKDGPGFQAGAQKFTVPLTKGRNLIRAIAVNNTGETSAEITVLHEGDGALDKRGTLYILAIGVDKYPGLGRACTEIDGKTPRNCDLRVAGADAKVFADAIATRLGPLHTSVKSTVLVNGGKSGEPVTANILDALGMFENSAPNDTVVLFVSGHGMNEGPNYIFMPSDAEFSGGRLRKSTVVPWANIQIAMETAKGRRLLFLDTCHSGNSYSQRLTNDAYEANIAVYSAARWDQEALEKPDLGHGLFTYAIVEGVNGAAKNTGGEVRTEGLREYMRVRVRDLARTLGADQEPQYYRGRDAEDYLLTRH